jgi:hypothetical protein
MKKFLFIIFIILLQYIYEVNTQAPKDIPSTGDPPPPPPAGALPVEGSVLSPAAAVPPSTIINTLTTLASRPTRILTPSASGLQTFPINSSKSPSESVKSTTDIIVASIVGGIVGNLILIFIVGLCFFLVRVYKNKKENSEAIVTPGMNIDENGNNINNTSNYEITNNEIVPNPTVVVISNQGQEINSSNHNNQQGIVHELRNNEIIQNIRQEMTQSVGRDPSRKLLSFNIDENIIDQMKQDILRDIKQELTQNIRTKVMASFFRDDNVDDGGSSSKNNDK